MPSEVTPELLELLASPNWLGGLARSLIVDPDLQDDVVQDVRVRLLRQPPEGVQHLRPWLRTVLRNQLANVLRDRHTRSDH